MRKITKAVIPAAGYGTRFLPQTKAMPKEMMPLVDKPIIQRVAEELIGVGIETIIVVTGWNKRSIEDHFDNNFELEYQLEQSGKHKELKEVRRISDMAQFVYIRQKGPKGNATPILNAKHILEDSPFMVFWGDDFVDAIPSRASQLLEVYKKYGGMVFGAVRAQSEEDYKKYGFASGLMIQDGVFQIEQIIEKPGVQNTPSDLAIVSGFIADSRIFSVLEQESLKLKEGQELVYTSAVQELINQGEKIYGIELKNAIYRDTGNKLEYLKTVVEYGLNHPELGLDFKNYLKNLLTKSVLFEVEA